MVNTRLSKTTGILLNSNLTRLPNTLSYFGGLRKQWWDRLLKLLQFSNLTKEFAYTGKDQQFFGFPSKRLAQAITSLFSLYTEIN